MWSLWWAWLSAAVVLGAIELAVPGYVFLGFALGAAVMGVVFLAGGPVAGAMAGSLPLTLLVFAVVSVIAWLILRRVLGVRKGQITLFDRDINED